MSTELLEIQPLELKFVFELKKQSSCSVRLVNKSNHHIAFKVKTTSPKKYCVRPNTGIIKPKSTCDFIVTMQGQRVPPPDMICKDKFLLQSTVVPVGTTDEDIEPSTFTKDVGKYVEEKKLRVILVSPPNSPVLSPINGTLKHVPPYEATKLKDQVLSRIENLSSHHTPREATTLKDQVLSRIENLSPHHTPRDSPITMVENLSPHHTVIEHVEEANMENGAELEPMKDVEFKTMKDVEEMKLIKDIEEMKSKLNEFESKLSEAEVTISKLTEERRLTTHERESLRQELTLLRSKKGMRRVQAGFPLLFVCMVALVSVMLGYLLHR